MVNGSLGRAGDLLFCFALKGDRSTAGLFSVLLFEIGEAPFFVTAAALGFVLALGSAFLGAGDASIDDVFSRLDGLGGRAGCVLALFYSTFFGAGYRLFGGTGRGEASTELDTEDGSGPFCLVLGGGRVPILLRPHEKVSVARK